MNKFFTFIFSIILSLNVCAQCPLPNAVDFTATDCHGTEIHLFDILDGGQYVLIDFFYTTCGECNNTVPMIVESYYAFGCNQHDVFYIEISDRDDVTQCLSWIGNHGVEYPTISGSAGGMSITDQYCISSLPTVILIAPDHRIVIHDLYPISTAQTIISALEDHDIQQYECMQNVDEALNNDIALYPNPADAFLKIDGKSLGDVTIFNALGQRVAGFVADDEMMVNTSHYPNGIYFVKVGDNIRRFVVTH